MLRQARERRERLRAGLAEAQATVEALCVEAERLELELLTTVRGAESGVETEDGGESILARLVTPVANSLPDLG
jgi:hypothetical protein